MSKSKAKNAKALMYIRDERTRAVEKMVNDARERKKTKDIIENIALYCLDTKRILDDFASIPREQGK